MIKKRIIVPKWYVGNGSHPKKVANCYSEKSFSKKCSQQQQVFSFSYQRTQPVAEFLTNTCLRLAFRAQPLPKLKTFPFLDEAMFIHK